MAPAASDRERKEKTETDVPAAPERQQDVDSTVDEKKRIEEALNFVGSCRAKLSEVLQAARRGHAAGSFNLRLLEFMDGELSFMFMHLNKALGLQHVDCDETMVRWLEELTHYGRTIDVCATLDDVADRQLQNTTLLRRAVQCFHLRSQYPYWSMRQAVKHFYGFAERSYWYGHLSTAISSLSLPRRVAEEGVGLQPVTLDWFQQSTYNFPYEIYLLTRCMIMFPYGYKFEKHRLVQKLLCEDGRLHFDLPPTAEEEAQRYFSDLVNRFAIKHAAANPRLGNADEEGAWQWNVNQLQHQFLVSKSAEMGFAFTSHTLNLLAAASATDHANQAIRTPRRLALHHDDPDIPSLLQNVDLSQTRSLAVSGGVSVPLHRFVNLVVLDVEGWDNFGDEDLLRICTTKMFFLVYLSIRSTRVSKLPPEINELRGLRALDASHTKVTELPFGDFEETRLRKLDLRGTPIRLLMSNQILGLQYRLVSLLLGGEGMINSSETATSLPHGIHRFGRLETLATVDLSEQPASFIHALGELRYLRMLAITWSFHQSSDRDCREALLSSIKKWEDLKSLTIHCGLGCSMEFLGSLSGRPQGLEKFKVIAGRFAGVPQWFHGLRHLSVVQITVCKLEARDLEILRDLPKLQCLVLGLDFIPKEAIVIQYEGFYELRRLSIECPVPWLTFESGAMPRLTYLQLELHACPVSPSSVPMSISNLYCSPLEVALRYNVRYANSSSIKRTVEAVRQEVAKTRNTTQMILLFINGIEQNDVQAVAEETGSATRAPSGTGAGADDATQEVDEITEA